MSLDLDPTEQRLAAALARLAEAHVPDADAPAAARRVATHRRWLVLAVAASLIALVVGIWAVADRDADPSIVTVPPTPTPTPAPTAAPTLDDPIAILDPARAPGEPTTIGTIDRYLAGIDQFASRSAVRRAADGTIETTLVLTLRRLGPAFGTSGLTIADRPAFRSVAEAAGRVAYLIDAGDLVMTVETELAAEDEVIDWLEPALARQTSATPDLDALAEPPGFDPLPVVVSTDSVSYVDGDATVDLRTQRFEVPIVASEWIAVETPGASITTDEAVTVVSNGQGITYLLWQPAPDVLVAVTAGADPTEWVPALRLASRSELLLTERVTWVSFQGSPYLDESALDRTVLGETALGRFAYFEQRGTDRGDCWAFAFEQLGGSSSCAPPSSVTSGAITEAGAPGITCFSSSDAGSTHTVAMTVDRDDATLAFARDGVPVEPTIERGEAEDGTPYLLAWISEDGETTPASGIGVSVDGQPCFGQP